MIHPILPIVAMISPMAKASAMLPVRANRTAPMIPRSPKMIAMMSVISRPTNTPPMIGRMLSIENSPPVEMIPRIAYPKVIIPAITGTIR